MRTVLRLPNWLGDAVMALPLVDRLQKEDPDLVLLIRAGLEYVFPPGMTVRTFRRRTELWARARELRREYAPSRMITLPQSFSAGLALYLSGAQERLAYDRGPARWFATRRIPLPEKGEEHRVQNYLRMLGSPPASPPHPRIHFTPEDLEQAERLLRRFDLGYRGFLVLAPFTAYGPTKTWPRDAFLQIARHVLRQGLPVVVMGGPGERERARPFEELPGVRVLVGSLPLRDSLRLLSAARGMVGNDSGLTHAAAALDVPTLALFLSTDPRWSRPLGPQVQVLQARVPCTPCHARTCPLGTYACHPALRVEHVVETLDTLLV
jgi:heptosyltransferase-2